MAPVLLLEMVTQKPLTRAICIYAHAVTAASNVAVLCHDICGGACDPDFYSLFPYSFQIAATPLVGLNNSTVFKPRISRSFPFIEVCIPESQLLRDDEKAKCLNGGGADPAIHLAGA